MNVLDIINNQVNDFIVLFARVGGFMAVAPFFGAQNVPVRIRTFASLALAIVFTTFLSPLDYTPSQTTTGLIIQLAGETAIGAGIGFAAAIFFEIVIFAGYIMDYMIGFGFINIVDPQSGVSISLFAFFYSFLALVLFILADGHHILIQAFLHSYELIPVFSAGMSGTAMETLTRLTSAVFYLGFQIAGPVFICMFMVDFSLGMVGKAVPQLQILVVGFPLKITIGLLTVGFSIKATSLFMVEQMNHFFEQLLWLMRYWGASP